MKEEWKYIEGHNMNYEISNKGRIRSLDRYYTSIDNKRYFYNGKILKQCSRKGYKEIRMTKYNNRVGKKVTYKIHRLVAQAFIPNPENKRCVNHKDGNPSNNNIDNLEWATHKENTIHAFKIGLMNPVKGGFIGNSKLNDKKVTEIHNKYQKGMSSTDLARDYNVARNTINEIVNGRLWTHLGLISRRPKWQLHSMRKLTEKQVIEIHNKYRNGVSCVDLAKEYNIAPNTISGIITGKNWSYLGMNSSKKEDKERMNKFCEKDIRDIRKKYSEGMSYNEIAEIYNASRSGISFIVKRKRWGHVA